MTFEGGCHCGAIALTFDTGRAAADLPLPACQCSFCRKHGVRATADPDGRLQIHVADPAQISRYTFGWATASYLICRTCGVYVAAVTTDAPPRGLVVVDALRDRLLFTATTGAVGYDGESRDARRARRQASWTPVTISGLDW